MEKITSIYVMGLGAIGSNLLVQLAKVYPDLTYFGIDYDKIEDRNLRTQAYYLEHINAPKTAAMLAILARHNRKIKYRPMNQKITGPIPLEKNALVLDCFDNPESRKIVKQLKNKDTLHIGFSPEFTAEVIWDKNYDVPGKVSSEVDICTLDSAGPFIHFVVNFAAMQIVEFMENEVKNDHLITGKYRIKKL